MKALKKFNQPKALLCNYSHNNAKRKPVNHGTRGTLLESMTRSLNREVTKFYKLKGYWEI